MSVHGKKQKKRQNSYVKATESGRKMMLKGKIAVVTGASRGIGRAIAVKLAAEGAVVIINYNRSKDEAEKVKEQIEASGDGLLMKMSEDDFDAVVDTNLKGAFHCIRFVSRAMIRQRSGRIINISSVSGVLGNAGQANYAASKAGVIGLTKSAARELAGRKITVNAVAPGFIRTEMTAVLSEKVKEKAVLQIPMERFGEAEDVAQAVAFLASEQAGYITGQVLCVDGGMAM